MTNKEIFVSIEQIKREIMIFEKLANHLKLTDKDRENQINRYLETLNKLIELQKKSNRLKTGAEISSITVYMKNYIEDIVTTKTNVGVDKKIDALKKKLDSDPALKNKIKNQFSIALNKRGKGIKQLEEEVAVKLQLKEIVQIVSMSYVAKKYFGQKKEWIYQRINGNIVNGKPASFTEQQKKKLNAALKDISKKIGSITVS